MKLYEKIDPATGLKYIGEIDAGDLPGDLDKVKVTATDKTAEYLEKKLKPGSRITITTKDNESVEYLEIAADGNIDGGFPSSVYLTSQLINGGGVG